MAKASGNLACLNEVVSHLREREPHLVLLVGIAGSLQPDKVKIGDVVISDRVKYIQPDKVRGLGLKEKFSENVSHERTNSVSELGDMLFIDANKRFMRNSYLRLRRDSIIWNPSSELYQDLIQEKEYIDFGLQPLRAVNYPSEAVSNARLPEVHFGAVLGSDWVIDSAEFVNFILKRDKSREADIYTQKYGSEDNERSTWTDDDLLSVDTESYGFFRGLFDNQGNNGFSKALVVRGISDIASGKEESDIADNGISRQQAARNAVNAALAIIDRY